MPANIDQLIRSRRKTVAIIVQRDGRVIVRAPLKAAAEAIEVFVQSKSEWIREKKALALQSAAAPARQFVSGEKFWLLGEQIPLRVVADQRTTLALRDEFLLAAKAAPDARAIFEKWYRARALTVLAERVNLLARKYGFQYAKLRITSARTRWGSCSSRGTLSFTWRLVMAPPEVIDYVVIHELAHTRVQNHSPAFWAEVARLMPGYKRSREWLRKNGRYLTLDRVQ